MKINRAELEEREIETLRELAQTNCNGVVCDFCPLRFTLSNGSRLCITDAAVSCLKQNKINPYERLKGEQNEQNN